MCPQHSFYPSFIQTVDDESSPFNSITTVITALLSVVGGFSCILLLAAICFCVIMPKKKKTHKKESQVSDHLATVSKQEEQGPRYEEVQMQNYPIYYTIP